MRVSETWLRDFFFKKYPLNEWMHEFKSYTANTAIGASTTATDSISISRDFWAFAVRSRVFVTSSGAAATFPVGFQIGITSADFWIDALVSSDLITGVNSQNLAAGLEDLSWPTPRECPINTKLVVKYDNSLFGTACTGHCAVVGLQVSKRQAAAF